MALKRLEHKTNYNNQFVYALYFEDDNYTITIDDIEVPFGTNDYDTAKGIYETFIEESLTSEQAHQVLLDIIKGETK